MKHFTIRANNIRYSGLFACSIDAVLDAMERFPGAARISVIAGPIVDKMRKGG